MNPRWVFQTVRALASQNGYTYFRLIGRERHKDITYVRRLVCIHLRAHGLSLPQIGRALGGRHHTTVMHYLGTAHRPRAKSQVQPGRAA